MEDAGCGKQRDRGLQPHTFNVLHLSLGDLQPLSFQPGMLYQYRYSLDVHLDHTSTPSPQGSRLQAEALVQLHRLWKDQGGEELLQVQVREMGKPLRPREQRCHLSIPSSFSSPSHLKNDLCDQEAITCR